jgi:hypothetical protein
MTASSMRFCRRSSWLALLAVLLLALAPAIAARAEGIEAQKAALIPAEDGGLILEAEFAVALTPTLEDALNKGVPLYFSVEFELIRPRWYWFNE